MPKAAPKKSAAKTTPKKAAVKKAATQITKASPKPVTKAAAPKKAPEKKATSPKKVSTKEVVVKVFSPESTIVELAGEFNNWNPSKGKMKREADGHWVIKLKLNPGTYQYKVVFDGTSWELDQQAESVMAEHGPNSVLHVG